MKFYFIIFTFVASMLVGCSTTEHFTVHYNNETIACKDVPKTWWGNRGEDPSKTDLWKCYSWELKAR